MSASANSGHLAFWEGHSAGGSPKPNSSPAWRPCLKDLSLNLIEVPCAGVTEVPSPWDAHHCWLMPIYEARKGRTM
jgi:hypothetical protein